MIDRKEYDETVRHPGKFEGCPAYIPYLWENALDGWADDFYDSEIGDRVYSAIEIDDKDREAFPEIGDTKIIVLWESDYGFVYHEEFTSVEEFMAFRRSVEETD